MCSRIHFPLGVPSSIGLRNERANLRGIIDSASCVWEVRH